MIKKIIIQYKFWFVLALLFVFLRLPSLFEPYWYGDEGIYLTLGQGIRRGLVLYRQIHDNKPPMLYYLAAFSQTVFGFRFLLFVWMVPTIYLFWKLSKNLLSKGHKTIATIFLILTSIPFVEGNIANAEIFMLLPTIAGFLFILNPKKIIYFLFSGLCLGFAFTIKIPVLVEFGFLFLWIYFENKKNKDLLKQLIYLSLGFIFPIFLFGIYYYLIGVFNDFIFASLLNNFGYLSSWVKGTQTASIGEGGLFTRAFFLLIFLIGIYFLKIKKIIGKNLSFVLFWLAFTVFGALLSARPYPHYLIQTLPPLCLLFGFLFYKERSIFLVIISFILYFLLISKYKFYFYPVLSYYQNSYSRIFFLKSENSYLKFFGSNVENNSKIAQFIKNNSNENDRIFVWGDDSNIYPMAHRLPASRYTVAYHVVDFNSYQDVIKSIEIFLPKFVVYFEMKNRPFEELDNLLDLYYSPDKVFGSTIIYKINEAN